MSWLSRIGKIANGADIIGSAIPGNVGNGIRIGAEVAQVVVGASTQDTTHREMAVAAIISSIPQFIARGTLSAALLKSATDEVEKWLQQENKDAGD